MQIEEQVTSLELSKKLRLLISSDKVNSAFTWVESLSKEDKGEYKLQSFSTQFYGAVHDYYAMGTEINVAHPMYPAYTVAELGEMLPRFYYSQQVYSDTESNRWECDVPDGILEDTDERFLSDTEADARAKCLIFLLENGLIKA